MLEVKNVCMGFGRRALLDNVSFRAEDGEILVLLGKNGCGKTTLLNAISGQSPFRGSILENGTELMSLPPAMRARRIGLMPQVLPVPHVKVDELVLFGRSPYMGFSGIPGKDDIELAEQAMQKARITDFRARYADTLSGGERQRCFFAMLLAQNPEVVLLDEPTANLDTEYRELLYDDVRTMRGDGKTVIMVMHHLAEACRVADRICVLHGGRVRFAGTPAEFADSAAVSEVFSMKVYRCTAENGEELRFFGA